ncbi:hypothetical protein pipiens_003952 [Culex pipiens pipiens]|uniref:Uncharacterized protein n=1 Tax=Culex pipiens pipiens TaxID=38569 RepID=A0ABD1CQD5_CULPP
MYSAVMPPMIGYARQVVSDDASAKMIMRKRNYARALFARTLLVAEVKTPSPTTEAVPATNGHAEEAPAGEKPSEETNGTSEKAADAKAEENAPPVKEMRAVTLTGFGGFKNVKILKKPEPSPQAGEVLIRVRAW